MGDAEADYAACGVKLGAVVDAVIDGYSSGSAAPVLVRRRRIMGRAGAAVDRAADLEADYRLLGELVGVVAGSVLAAVVAEREMIRRDLVELSGPSEETKIERLESWRAARAADIGASGRRRRSAG